MKMEKTPRYTQRERNMVLGYAAQYKDIIENKRTDAESNRKKDEVWRQIAKEFNARVYHQRSSKQLRQLYKNMKLLLKKDLCGEGKGNRTFMDLLNTISQQESVAQYISEQMSPSGYSNGRQKYEDDYDDSKFLPFQHPALSYDGMDHDVIVIKSEDLSDNEQSNQDEAMDEDDDDCLSPKDIPEVCLEEADDEVLFATDLRQQLQQSSIKAAQQQNGSSGNAAQSQGMQTQSTQQQQQAASLSQSQQTQQPEVTIQNIGGIRVGSIGSLANMKALQSASNGNGSSNNSSNNTSSNANSNNSKDNSHSPNNSALGLSHSNGGVGSAGGQPLNLRQASAEQQLLLSGLGLSAVNPGQHLEGGSRGGMPTLQRGSSAATAQLTPSTTLHNLATNAAAAQQLLLNINSLGGALGSHPYGTPHKSYGQQRQTSTPNSGGHKNSQNDYFLLGIEERKLKIELLNAQIDYWKKLTKKLDEAPGHSPNPACMCHFPGKMNGVQTPSSTS